MTRRLVMWLSAGIFLFAAGSVSANSGIGLGVQGGMTFADFSSAAFPDSSRTGFAVGVNAEMMLVDHIYFQPEMSFLQGGSNPLLPAGTTFRYDTIEFTPLGKLKFGNSDMAVEVLAGPSLGLAVTRSSVTTVPGALISGPAVDYSLRMSGTNFSLVFGAGAEFRVNNVSAVFIQGRYNFGLSDINSFPGSLALAPVYTRSIQVLAGIRFWIS